MHGARAVLIEHLVVELCAVALVPGELILGIHRVEHFDHIMVTADLRQHARRAMDKLAPSPPTMVSCGVVIFADAPWSRLPSMSA